jgi:hypothetical protein
MSIEIRTRLLEEFKKKNNVKHFSERDFSDFLAHKIDTLEEYYSRIAINEINEADLPFRYKYLVDNFIKKSSQHYSLVVVDDIVYKKKVNSTQINKFIQDNSLSDSLKKDFLSFFKYVDCFGYVINLNKD